MFSKSEDIVYIDIVGDPIFNIYDDVVMEEKDAHVKSSICDDDENNFIKIARMSDGHVVAVWEDGFATTKNLHVSTKEDVTYVFNSTRSQSDVSLEFWNKKGGFTQIMKILAKGNTCLIICLERNNKKVKRYHTGRVTQK